MKPKEVILKELNDIFQTIFKNNAIVIDEGTSADDINGWNSLTHMYLIDAVEKHFGCEFGFSEVMAFRNVGDMVNALANKGS